MLISSQLSQVPTVERLVTIWANRYLPDLSVLSIGDSASARSELREAASPVGRIHAVAKLSQPLVEEKCKLAALRVKDLYYHLPQNCDLMEVIRLSRFASRVYLKLLEVYQQLPSAKISKEELQMTFGDSPLAAWGIPRISKLAELLEPLLLEFQEQHLISKDWRSIGFITTQINLSNALLLEELTPAEQVLINPYFAFLEEQVALPWQRVCAAAANHDSASPVFLVVEQMMPKAAEISEAAYDRLYRALPNHYSRRGRLDNPAVKHSSLRDFSMFQAYLWLCVLKGDSTVIEHELVALCMMVLECIDVPWETTIRGVETLMNEILSRLDPVQQTLVSPYAEGIIQAFHAKRHVTRDLPFMPRLPLGIYKS